MPLDDDRLTDTKFKQVEKYVTTDRPTEVKELEQECGPMPNVMAALPNIGGALCSMPQSLADAHY